MSPLEKLFMKILMISPLYKAKDEDSSKDFSIEDILECSESELGFMKALMNLIVLKKDGVYLNNKAKLEIAENEKVKGSKNMSLGLNWGTFVENPVPMPTPPFTTIEPVF